MCIRLTIASKRFCLAIRRSRRVMVCCARRVKSRLPPPQGKGGELFQSLIVGTLMGMLATVGPLKLTLCFPLPWLNRAFVVRCSAPMRASMWPNRDSRASCQRSRVRTRFDEMAGFDV
jgi:hypothetical protein